MIELSRLKFVFCLLETNCSYIIKQDNYYLENQMARFKTMKKMAKQFMSILTTTQVIFIVKFQSLHWNIWMKFAIANGKTI